MDLRVRLAVLDRLYGVYDRFKDGFGAFACRKGCAACCTGNVTATTLEVFRLLEGLPTERSDGLRDVLAAASRRRRYRPTVTLNETAERILKGVEVPDEGGDPRWGPCPLIDEAVCTIYELRPFGCRSFFSTADCVREGVADVPPELVTLNTVMFQIIEHIDRPGCTGNLTDVLLCMGTPMCRDRYRGGRPECSEAGLRVNRPAPVLMVPPEHREFMGPVLAALHAITVPEG